MADQRPGCETTMVAAELLAIQRAHPQALRRACDSTGWAAAAVKVMPEGLGSLSCFSRIQR